MSESHDPRRDRTDDGVPFSGRDASGEQKSFWPSTSPVAWVSEGVVCLAALALLLGLYLAERRTHAEAPKDAIFYTAFGGMYCGNMEYTRCGLRLWNCVDEREYVCLVNVAIRKQ